MSNMLLEAKELHTDYGASHILHGIDFNIREGEGIALMGRNGMGKSTLIKSMLGLVRPRHGRVLVRGDDYTKARDEMFAATDSSWAPWFVARSEDKKRVRLNVISHLLEHVPYKKVPANKVTLPKRKIGRSKGAAYPFKYVPDYVPAESGPAKSRKVK